MGAVMAPGRELDALVAEKVLGYEITPGGYTGYLPSFSTDIAAAWEVVEKLRAMNSTLELYSPGALVNDEMGIHAVEWQATFKSWEEPWGPHGPSVEAQTAPHAICLAALKAVGAL